VVPAPQEQQNRRYHDDHKNGIVAQPTAAA
jgi:hypothetical protein